MAPQGHMSPSISVLFFLLTIGLPLLGHARPNECGERNASGGTIFSLSMARAFHPNVEFKLCGRKESGKSFLLVTEQKSLGSRRANTRSIVLDEITKASVLSLYEKALDCNVKDETVGLDGSSWCLETTRVMTYSKACFWTPVSHADDRGIAGLQALGTELWRLGKFDLKDLY
jgi:hypothetical protein